MKIKKIIRSIDELRNIVSEWAEGGEPSSLEMDMALDRVKCIYEMLRFPTEEIEETEEEVVVEETEPEVEIEIEVEPEIEIEPEVEVEVEPETEPETEDLSEKELKRLKHQKILSLYGDSPQEEEVTAPVPTPTPTPTPAPAPAPAPAPTPAPATESRYSILDTLGFNDRLLFSSELFGGDMQSMEQAIARIESEPTLDDALLHIAQHHRWGGDNEAAKLLYKLLQNRYL